MKGGQGVMCCVKFVEYFHPLAVNLREGVGELLHMGHVWIQAVRLTFDCVRVLPLAVYPCAPNGIYVGK